MLCTGSQMDPRCAAGVNAAGGGLVDVACTNDDGPVVLRGRFITIWSSQRMVVCEIAAFMPQAGQSGFGNCEYGKLVDWARHPIKAENAIVRVGDVARNEFFYKVWQFASLPHTLSPDILLSCPLLSCSLALTYHGVTRSTQREIASFHRTHSSHWIEASRLLRPKIS